MLLSFFEGIIAAIGALAVELSPPIFGLAFSETTLISLLFAASVEEIIKYAFIYNHYLKLKTKEQILPSAFFIGLGFALIDILPKQLANQENAISPFFGIFLIHLFTTTALGLFFWKKGQKPLYLSSLVLILNILLHFFYNFLVLRF